MSALDLSLVIACYHEESHLEASVLELEEVLRQAQLSFELIFIDDASTDGTPAIVERLAAERSHARAVLHADNVGRGGTVEEGFRMATGRVVGYLDIDLEVSPVYVPAMVAAIIGGEHQGATAYRTYDFRLRHILRHVMSRGYRILFRLLMCSPFRDTEAGYKFFDREAILPVLDETEHTGWFWDTEVLVLAHRAGLSVVELPCTFVQKPEKASTVRPVRDSLGQLRALLAFRRRLGAH